MSVTVSISGNTSPTITATTGDTIDVTVSPAGAQGPQGTQGPAGPANTLSIGTVTSGTAAATITGTAPNQTLNLVLPAGSTGATGSKGDTGSQGPAGPANTLSIGTVTSGTAAATITGTAPNQVLNLVLQKGDAGATGPQGPAGPAVNLADETPQPLGTASAGTALSAARADHVHSQGSIAYSGLTGIPLTFPPSAHAHAVSEVTGLQTALDGKQAAGNYATLVGGTVPSSMLPSYVDDVIEYANLAAFTDQSTGKIYVARDTGKIYRWSGSAYIEISPSPGTTTDVPEGTNLYFTNARAAAAAPVQSVAGRTGTVTLTKSDVGLGSVLNVDATLRSTHYGTQLASTISDFATEAAKYAPVTSVAGRTGAVTLAKADVGLGSVLNVDATLRSTHYGVQLASTISDFATEAAKYGPVTSVSGRSGAVTLAKADVGLGNVDNTADTAKPVSTAQAAADAAVQEYSIQRANHTGTQTISTVSGLQSALDGKQASGSYASSSHTHSLSDISQSSATTGQVPTWNGTAWAAATPSGGGGGSYTLPTATSSVLGGIKVGSGLTITDGVLAAAGSSGLTWSSVPASATATGTAGQIAWDANYQYTCVATNTWKRTALSTWSLYRVFDSFGASDGTTISGRSPESGGALPQTWAATLFGTNAANCVIRNNRLQADNYSGSPNTGNNNYSFATVYSGASDATITATFVLGSRDSEYAYCGLAARFTNFDNRIAVTLVRNGSVDVGFAMRLQQHSGGTFTSLGTTGTGTSFTAGTEYTVTLVLSGTSVTATASNGLTLSATSSVNQTTTTHGLFIGHTGDSGSGSVTYLDNFSIA